MPKEHVLKLLIVGDSGVGKTSLVNRFVKDYFEDTTEVTSETNYSVKQLELNSDIAASLQLWDFGGPLRLKHILNNYVMGARGALLLIDMTRNLKIINILEWVNMVRMHDISLPIILVGTKCDLKDSIVVNKEQIQHVRDVFNMYDYIETSAKDSINIFKVFYSIAKLLIERRS